MFTVLIGVILIVVGYMFLPASESPYRTIMLAIAQAVLVGGVVGVLTNALRYIGIFEQVVCDVVHGDKHLATRSDLPEIWTRVTSALTKGKFPQLTDYLRTDVIKNYIPAEKDFYYSRYYRECILRWADEDRSIVEIDENIEIDIVTDAAKIDYGYRCDTTSRTSHLQDHFVLVSLDIDGVDHVSALTVADYDDEYGKKGVRHSYAIPLTGRSTYFVQRSTRRRMEIDREPFMEYSSRNFILDTTVKFRSESDDLQPAFTSVGTDDFDNRWRKGSAWQVHREFKSLMFPNQGYMLVMQRTAPISGRQGVR